MAALGLGSITYGTWWGVVSGAGIGISTVAGITIGTDVPDHLTGSASGVSNTGAQLGTAIGVAALVLVASTISLGPIQGTAVAWAAASFAALAAALWLNRSPAR